MLKQIGQTFRKSRTKRYSDDIGVEFKSDYDRKSGACIVKVDSKLTLDDLGRVCLQEKHSRWYNTIQFENKEKLITELITGKHNISDSMIIKGYGLLKSKGYDTTIQFFKTKEELGAELKLKRQKYKLDASLKDVIKKHKKLNGVD